MRCPQPQRHTLVHLGTCRHSNLRVPGQNNSADKLLQLFKSNLTSSRLQIPHRHLLLHLLLADADADGTVFLVSTDG